MLLLEMKNSDLAEKQQRLRRELDLEIQELNTVDSIEVAPENKTKKGKERKFYSKNLITTILKKILLSIRV
jgi:hypothetical protein